MANTGRIRVGIGGWSYEPWRETFYPDTLPSREELHYASRRLTAIEINSTFYRAPGPEVYERWRSETPDGFMFSLKAPRYITHRKVLAEAGDSVARFLEGAGRLGDRLGPVVWQLPPSKRFDTQDLSAFLALLPEQVAGLRLRHVVEARHDSFRVPEFLSLVRSRGVAVVYTDSPDYPNFADLSGDFVYARLMCSQPDLPTGYPDEDLDLWLDRARLWAQGQVAADLPRIDTTQDTGAAPRDVFIYFINGAKENAPGAAGALLHRLGVLDAQGQVAALP
ncbi:DUF72 domain-containing protein [Caldimonas brevitalea]|uniref:DUF72 domain-containing protein n=1 Tax=Caldimonas brevitalea TaxID=413882 RepID=A0A0G3BT98_9BURK|nr:DUF72 domain-containing protein [Caldimonas brevitalea]AKJ31238.1 hypothetical protein AAW51_4547 [Caldimonas brevitalea]